MNSRVWLGRSSYGRKSWKKWSDYRPTDRPTDTVNYKVACTRLKTEIDCDVTNKKMNRFHTMVYLTVWAPWSCPYLPFIQVGNALYGQGTFKSDVKTIPDGVWVWHVITLASIIIPHDEPLCAGRSFIYKRKKRGPSILPWGTPTTYHFRLRSWAFFHELPTLGGAIRDVLIGLSPTDMDLATDASPQLVELIVSTSPGLAFGNAPKKSRRFGSYKVRGMG